MSFTEMDAKVEREAIRAAGGTRKWMRRRIVNWVAVGPFPTTDADGKPVLAQPTGPRISTRRRAYNQGADGMLRRVESKPPSKRSRRPAIRARKQAAQKLVDIVLAAKERS